MRLSRAILTRRAVLAGAALAAADIVPARGQNALERTKKFEAWVEYVRKGSVVSPMSNGRMLGFPTAEVQRKQIGVTKDGVQRLFAVVLPDQRDGIVLAAGNAETRTFTVHRTGTHLRRFASVRNDGGRLARWSGPDCEADFAAQVSYWVEAPIA